MQKGGRGGNKRSRTCMCELHTRRCACAVPLVLRLWGGKVGPGRGPECEFLQRGEGGGQAEQAGTRLGWEKGRGGQWRVVCW